MGGLSAWGLLSLGQVSGCCPQRTQGSWRVGTQEHPAGDAMGQLGRMWSLGRGGQRRTSRGDSLLDRQR